jgi:hypothetical protein
MAFRLKAFAVRLAVAIAVIGIFVAQPGEARSQDRPAVARADESSPSFWMERKMKLSTDMLAALANGNAEKVAASGKAMRRLNTIEAFSRRRSPGYDAQLEIFSQSLDEIIAQAEKDNLEGAALGFTQLTISCVNCHKRLRESK